MHKKCDKTDLKSIDIIIIVQNIYWIEPGCRPSFFGLDMREFGREFGHEWILLTLDTLITLLLGLQILGNAYFNPETYTPWNAQKTHFHRSTCLLSKVISAYFVGIYFLVPIMPIHCLYWHFSKKCYVFIVKSGFLGKITKNFDKINKIATVLSGKIVDSIYRPTSFHFINTLP